MISNAIDAGAFNAFEKQGWQSSAGSYDRYFGPMTARAGAALLEALEPSPAGKSLLDLATGPGYLAFRAETMGYRSVVGIDFSDAMIALAQLAARASGSTVEFQSGDAECLREADASFDAVTMNFGLLHLGQPQRAIDEAFRVLKPSGRFGFTVWAEPERAKGFAIILKAIDSLADKKVPIPNGPPFFHFSDELRSHEAMRAAGFTGIRVQHVELTWELGSGEELFDAFLHGTARTGGLLRAQRSEALDAIRRSVVRDVGQFRSDAGIRIPMSVVLVTGTRA